MELLPRQRLKSMYTLPAILIPQLFNRRNGIAPTESPYPLNAPQVRVVTQS